MGWGHWAQNIIKLPRDPTEAYENGFKEMCQDADPFPLRSKGGNGRSWANAGHLGG